MHRCIVKLRELRWTLCAALSVFLVLPFASSEAQVLTPSERYGELYRRVEMERVYPDSKSFADAEPIGTPKSILESYTKEQPATRQALQEFVQVHFKLPDVEVMAPAIVKQQSLLEHISSLWPQLTRAPVKASGTSSQLPFNFIHVVPGGRFRETYYWDSYFTLLGLILDGHADVARGTVNSFAYLIARYDHVPNGTRSYYLSRSQPPFFYLMVGLMTPLHPEVSYAQYLKYLRREHAFWMRGEKGLKKSAASEHVVRLSNGSLLNRYWDALDTPRDESYREDATLAQNSNREPRELYRDLRSAAESGWDFSSRWLSDGQTLATIETTNIVPVDLNALLYGLEKAIHQGCIQVKDINCAKEFSRRASLRKQAMNRFLWDAKDERYLDFQWREGVTTGRLSAATLYPLFTGASSDEQASAVARTVRAELLVQGGLATTTIRTGQQWDQPNGWAPLQWIAVKGLARYGEKELANEISQRWLQTVQMSYDATGKLVEKYNVSKQSSGGGGEYPLQDGFGWTNGVTRALLARQQETQ